jgi:hypothetical protein
MVCRLWSVDSVLEVIAINVVDESVNIESGYDEGCSLWGMQSVGDAVCGENSVGSQRNNM